MSDVTIIGLGQMGVRLAELLHGAGKSVTLWNRTEARAASLVAAGVTLAASPAAAIAASPVTILILSDDQAVDAVLASAGVGGVLAGAGSSPISAPTRPPPPRILPAVSRRRRAAISTARFRLRPARWVSPIRRC